MQDLVAEISFFCKNLKLCLHLEDKVGRYSPWFRLDPPKVKIWHKKSRKQTTWRAARTPALLQNRWRDPSNYLNSQRVS